MDVSCHSSVSWTSENIWPGGAKFWKLVQSWRQWNEGQNCKVDEHVAQKCQLPPPSFPRIRLIVFGRRSRSGWHRLLKTTQPHHIFNLRDFSSFIIHHSFIFIDLRDCWGGCMSMREDAFHFRVMWQCRLGCGPSRIDMWLHDSIFIMNTSWLAVDDGCYKNQRILRQKENWDRNTSNYNDAHVSHNNICLDRNTWASENCNLAQFCM